MVIVTDRLVTSTGVTEEVEKVPEPLEATRLTASILTLVTLASAILAVVTLELAILVVVTESVAS